MKRETYAKNNVIFRQGDPSSAMYSVLWGTVVIYADYGTKRQKKLAELHEGEYFGEMGMLEAYPRSASAVAMENGTQVDVISAEDFESYFMDKPAKVYQIMQHLSYRLRRLTRDYLEVCRAASEAEGAEERGGEKSGRLKKRLKFFSGEYRQAETSGAAQSAERSSQILVMSSGKGIMEALTETERFASAQGLEAKQAIRARLLCEEMMGMFRSIAGGIEADYWVEARGNEFQLHLTASTRMDMELREELLAAASSGKNSAARGISGKLRDIFETYVLNAEEVDQLSTQYGGLPLTYGAMGLTGDEMLLSSSYAWSLQRYRMNVEATKNAGEHAEAWDELEKSVVAKLADEVRIGIRGNDVEMIIYKKF